MNADIHNAIIVVGGGSLGLSISYQLVHKAIAHKCAECLKISLVEPRTRLGAGQAYEDDLESNLLNTRADTMSVVYEDPHHFVDWLRNNQRRWRERFPKVVVEPSAFLPRPLFGMYLEHTFDVLKATAWRYNIELTHVQSEAIDLLEDDDDDSVTVQLADGRYLSGSYVVLSIGNLRPRKFDHLLDNPQFFNNPYPTTRLVEAIPRDASVGIIGSSLNAIDAVIALSEKSHHGKLFSVSRSGRLPSVRGGENQKHQLKLLTKKAIEELYLKHPNGITLEDIFQILVAEINGIQRNQTNINTILNAEAGMHAYLSEEINLANRGNRTWQSVVYATNAIIDHLWNRLATDEKHRFWKFFRSQWFSYRVSFPIENAMKLQELMRVDQLTVYSGMVGVNFCPKRKRFEVELLDPQRDTRQVISTRYIINATGFSISVVESDMPIVRRLLERGLAKPCVFGGFQVDYESGRLLDALDRPCSRTYVLGSMTSGTYFFTNAMDVNARHAMLRANEIIKRIARFKTPSKLSKIKVEPVTQRRTLH
jgi:uncharacterized NAD(P)/FAD-binding protein YdhS